MGWESSCSSNVVLLKIFSSSRNCLIKAPCIVALLPHIVSDSVDDSGMSFVCPDLAATDPWPLRKKKNHPPVDLKVSSSSAWAESTQQ